MGKFGSALLALSVFSNIKLNLVLNPLRPILVYYSFQDEKGPLIFQVRRTGGEDLIDDG